MFEDLLVFEKTVDFQALSLKKLLSSNPIPILRPALAHLWDFDIFLPSREEARSWTESAPFFRNQLSPEISPKLSPELSGNELERARQFLKDEDRAFYLISRWILRGLLGAYIGAPLDAIPFERAPGGKPRLPASVHSPREMEKIDFNLSHSGNRLLIAIAKGERIGVDIEKPRCPDAFRGIAERFLSEGENRILKDARSGSDSSPGEEEKELFLRLWTCKEAWIKAVGGTLFSHLSRSEVSLGPGRPARIISFADREVEASPWRLQEMRLKGGFFAAVARGPRGVNT